MSVECVCVYAAHMPISMYICNYAHRERERKGTESIDRERERERDSQKSVMFIIEYSSKRHS